MDTSEGRNHGAARAAAVDGTASSTAEPEDTEGDDDVGLEASAEESLVTAAFGPGTVGSGAIGAAPEGEAAMGGTSESAAAVVAGEDDAGPATAVLPAGEEAAGGRPVGEAFRGRGQRPAVVLVTTMASG